MIMVPTYVFGDEWILNGYWILDTKYLMDTKRILSGYWILNTGYWILDTGYKSFTLQPTRLGSNQQKQKHHNTCLCLPHTTTSLYFTSEMTLSQVHFLQRLTTTHLRKEQGHADDYDSVSSSSSSDEEELANESCNLPTFFLGMPILREERRTHSREESTQSRGNRTEEGETNGAAASPRGKIAQQRETSSKNWMMIHLTSIFLLALLARVIGSKWSWTVALEVCT